MRSQWWTLGFVFSPLALALLYSAIIDGESFGAFIFGILLSLIFGAAVLARRIAKKQEEKPLPCEKERQTHSG